MLRRLLAAAALALAVVTPAYSQTWPAKPVRIIVPFPPGGTTDIVARSIGVELQRMWQQPVVIENRPGAGGNIGADQVAKSPPDGYTLLMGTVGTHAINQALYTQSGSKMSFDPVRDFVPITLVAGVPNVMVINPKVAGEHGDRVHCLRQGTSRAAQHGVERQRDLDPSVRRAVQDDDRHLHGPLPVSRLRAGADRSDRRQHERDVRQPAIGAAAHQERPAEGACGHVARRAHRRCPTCRPSRRRPG